MHNDQNVVTDGICVGPIPESKPIQYKCTRGDDKKSVHHTPVQGAKSGTQNRGNAKAQAMVGLLTTIVLV